jgi:hypothetical protein
MAGGKSFLLRWSALLFLIFLYKKYKIEGIQVGLFSEDYPTLKDRQIARIEREFPSWLGKIKDDRIHGLCFQLADGLGGGIIMLRNLDDPAKYMSTEFAGEFVEELTRNDEQTFEDLRNRLRYPKIEDVKFMGATNPGGIGHGWVRKYFIDKNHEDPEKDRFYYIHANAYDNSYISPNYIKQLESLPPMKRKAYLEGSWDVFAGQVFTEFSRNLHIARQFVPNKELLIIGGLDWGRSRPFAFNLTVIQEKKYEGIPYNRAWTFFEAYGIERTPKEWVEIIKENLKIYKLIPEDIRYIEADPSIFTKGDDNSISIADQLEYKNGNELEGLRRLRPASNDRIGGWENIHNWLSLAPDGLPYWMITENCVNLIRTLPQLVYDETKYEDVDTEGEDHAPDAVRYCLKSIKWIDAKVGTFGMTREKKPQTTAEMVQGRQMGLDPDRFTNAFKDGRPYYK